MRKKPNPKQNSDQKIPVFLRLAPAVHAWLEIDVKAGRYGNVQEKIAEILRREQESEVARAA